MKIRKEDALQEIDFVALFLFLGSNFEFLFLYVFICRYSRGKKETFVKSGVHITNREKSWERVGLFTYQKHKQPCLQEFFLCLAYINLLHDYTLTVCRNLF